MKVSLLPQRNQEISPSLWLICWCPSGPNGIPAPAGHLASAPDRNADGLPAQTCTWLLEQSGVHGPLWVDAMP